MFTKSKLFSLFLLTFTLFSTNLFSQNAADTLYVSKAEYFSESYNSKNQVLPVLIKFNPSKETTCDYKLYFSSSENGNYSLIKEFSNQKSVYYVHDSKEFIPCQKYYYKLEQIDSKTKKIIKTFSSCGWGALTPELYFAVYNKYIKISWNKLTLMNKEKNLDKLGDETINGNKTGSLHYYTKISGLSGIVTMDYLNYCDDESWKFSGTMETQAYLTGNGEMRGKIEVSGMYPGTVYYDKVLIKKNKAGGGTYGIFPKGYKRTELDYSLNEVIYGE